MNYFREELYGTSYLQSLSIDRPIFSGRSEHQKVMLFENRVFGKVLALDDIVQTTEKDEFIYHEMLVHVPIFAYQKARKVLVIGGGDGGAIEEIFKHPFIDKVVMVEIDKMVVNLSKKYLRKICKSAFSDKRLELILEDGVKYVSSTREKFDIVIVDSPDPIGPGKMLFSEEFYHGVHNVLKDKGVFARQTGSSFLQRRELQESMKILNKIFDFVAPYVAAVPTYVGGFFTFVLGLKGRKGLPDFLSMRKSFEAFDLETNYFSPEIANAAFVLPRYIHKSLSNFEET